ncbi:sulfite exporter TauE/SafE family protein [Paenibacillus agricola]|uniref:sulfite exporter TauE/SafE family protein n=1 Tax=Paenibacillus agricola TaxID=2716264 RepID=UPI001A9E9AAA|nr:sulfite exporter TauE/SafE family protein [Paenibacillus agricola]
MLLAGLAAGAVSGVIGTGSSIILLPVLVFAFGPKEAVPIMAMAAIMGNLARVMAWWREIDWKAFAAYSITGVPAAAFGARTLWILPVDMINIGLGLFFLLMIPTRHWLKSRNFQISLWQLSIAGAIIGFMTGMVLSTGPLSVPAFTSYGLLKGAFLSTEAASSLVLYISKVVTFRELGALPLEIISQGLIVGASLMLGTFAGKAIVLRLNVGTFQYLLDALLLGSGLLLLWAALFQS